jgi:ribosomal protein S18 acetylase RimI-like enzyme
MDNKIIPTSAEYKEETVNLYKEFIKETNSTNPQDIYMRYNSFLNSEGSYLYIVISEEKPIGFIEFVKLPLKLRDEKPKIEITSLFVKKEFRREKIGKALVEFVLNFSKEKNCAGVVLYSGIQMKKVHKFYERIGFNKKAYYFEKKI